jgi:hypothetical protein
MQFTYQPGITAGRQENFSHMPPNIVKEYGCRNKSFPM